MNREPAPCLMCSRFHRRADALPAHGYCDGYEKQRRHDETNEACPLWKEAAEKAKRRAWAEQQTKEKN